MAFLATLVDALFETGSTDITVALATKMIILNDTRMAI
jgi:hypothetical protein|eukprot:CAMPEP_0202501856 /NCGR_PEP_ID=MMETSP1361-20130828/37476_1 /ASSEMBLY_ACC=CAM_ASM_000849 /TAXON_ID=210615 /ORGANISM="Staurosira complex sp., Strain CCMP2646" /LENGTH=37 /DNA_ID= /DNA_START= /DNA_END= /DNA_ORIENTATION=